MNSGFLISVTGAVPAAELGMTLAHEHLWCDISLHSGKADNTLHDVDTIVEELGYFRRAGGRAIFEMTVEGIGRDAAKLREISAASGVVIVSGIAFYDESTWPAWLRGSSVSQIADYFVRHLDEGEAGVRAGFIGELMSHNEPVPNPSYRLREAETHLFRAAAQAQRRTGTAISTHASLGRAGIAQLDVLERAGADLGRVVIGHCDAHWHEEMQRDMDYYLAILGRGACCEFDMVGWSDLVPDDARADRVAALAAMGFAPRVLLSMDTCRRSQWHRNGGRGYDFLWHSFLPRLRARGVTDAQIHAMLVEAPARVFARTSP